MRDIHKIRQDINTISLEICNSLLKRKRLVEEIHRIKREMNLTIYDSEREQELLDILTEDQTQEDQEYIKRVFQAILTEMR